MNDSGILDEAYERLHRTGPEFDGWLSNHGPMAVESMVRHGYDRQVHRWLDTYVGRLDELPRGTSPIDAGEWRQALGDPRRLGDWLAFFDRELKERPWRAVLETWWPRLLPGIAAGATHGVIRTGHAVHALLERRDVARQDEARQDEARRDEARRDEARLAELGQALGYWAARWQAIAGVLAPSGSATPGSALAGVPRVPDQSKGINHRLDQLAGVDGWNPSLAALRPAADAEQARALLADLADAATLRYATHAHGSPIMLVHTATAPTAVLRTLPALPAKLWVASLEAAWAAGAAVTAAYAPAEGASREELPGVPGSAEEAFDQAVRHGDEHVIKLADTALDVHRRTGDPDALVAVARASGLIKPFLS
ncbi:questin oxidase family protein [Nonomuraea sp. NPDC049695]|uniref:questin oxidase family protein n=1 Tax=Nonomuraea sp. NPDC049695 TaxID=3154734 RepID=UPI00343BD118